MRVFIAYALKDEELARQLGAQLRGAGFDVWRESEQIEPGENWAKKMGQGLDESDLMVALFTRGTAGSDTLQQVVRYGFMSSNFDHRLIPVLVGFVNFAPGKDVPWILLKLDPVYIETEASCVESPSIAFAEVVRRAQAIAAQGAQETHAAR